MNILLVEDDPAALETFSQALALSFPTFTVEKVTSAEEAEARVDEGFEPALVITDVRLPGRSGLELLFRLQDRSSKVRFILISGYTPPELGRYAEGDRVLRYLAKPFELSQLVSEVQNAFLNDQASGSHKTITFIDILQVLNMSQRTALIEVVEDERTAGEIFLVRGEVHHATADVLEGEDAFRELCAAPDRPFRVRSNQASPKRTIERSFGTLLIDVMSEEEE